MKGILTKNKEGKWMVKWSDLHSFAQGVHWTFTEVSQESNSIKYIRDNQIMYKPLEEGLYVEFEHQIKYVNKADRIPSINAKLIFPEVDEFEKHKHENQH